ncbi:hypothetical protein [Flavobacterium sp.]|jgi:hypothetical protein|uniref:hypothetical protein n=1 Tax=Flavobacterium sp. TaxID=239 RepID=UPI0037BFF396
MLTFAETFAIAPSTHYRAAMPAPISAPSPATHIVPEVSAHDLAQVLLEQNSNDFKLSHAALHRMRTMFEDVLFARTKVLLSLQVIDYSMLSVWLVGSKLDPSAQEGPLLSQRFEQLSVIASKAHFDEFSLTTSRGYKFINLRSGDVRGAVMAGLEVRLELLKPEELVRWVSWQFDELAERELR